MEQELERRGHRFAPYGDDFLLVLKRPRAGARGKARLTRFLPPHLKRESTESKSTVGPPPEGVVLGFTFQGPRLEWAPEAVPDFRHRLRKLTARSWGVSRADRSRNLTEYSRGGVHYFGLSQYYPPRPDLAAWWRRRLRRGCWKQWRSVRTTVRERLQPGTAKTTALLPAWSRKGPGPLSRTLATQTARTTQGLSESLGLVSMRALWSALPSPT